MSTLNRSIAFGVLVFAASVVGANADQPSQSNPRATQVAAEASVPLPMVFVHPRVQDPSWFYDPYTGGKSQHASSLNHIPAQHYKVPVGYDSNMWMHPYTSGTGPCTEGASPSQGCHHPTSSPIAGSHYERAPFNQ